MELNNEGDNDLDTWVDIQKNLLRRSKPDNCISFEQLNVPNQEPIFLIEDNLLNRELDNVVQGTQKERNILSVIDLVSSLTRRIARVDFINEDRGIYSVYNSVAETFLKIFEHREHVEYFLLKGTMKEVKHYKNSRIYKFFHSKVYE